jgi:hypothetical protein
LCNTLLNGYFFNAKYLMEVIVKTSLFRTLLTTALLGLAAVGSLCAMNGEGKPEKEAYSTEEAIQRDAVRKAAQHERERCGDFTPDDSCASSYASPLDESSSSSASTGKSGMDLGLGLGTGVDADIDTDEQKAIQPTNASSSSTYGSAQETVLGNEELLEHIASFLVGSNSTNPEQMVTAFFKPASFWQHNGRTDFFNFQRVNKAVYKSLRPTVQGIRTYLNNLDEPAYRNLLLPMAEQGIYPAAKIIIENLQRLHSPLTTITDANGNNALHLASQRGDVRMRELIRKADQALNTQQNHANKTPYQLCSWLTKLRLHDAKRALLFSLVFCLVGVTAVALLDESMSPDMIAGIIGCM